MPCSRIGTRSQAGRLRGNIEEHGWTANGIAGRTSTTARRWARPRTRNAKSMRSRKAGPISPVPARRNEPRSDGERSIAASSARCPLDPAARSAVRQVKPQPGYIKGYAPGVRENGRAIHAQRHLDRDAHCCVGEQRAGVGLFRLINPFLTARRRRRSRPTASSRMWSPPTFGVDPNTVAAAGTLYTGSAGGLPPDCESLLGPATWEVTKLRSRPLPCVE